MLDRHSALHRPRTRHRINLHRPACTCNAMYPFLFCSSRSKHPDPLGPIYSFVLLFSLVVPCGRTRARARRTQQTLIAINCCARSRVRAEFYCVTRGWPLSFSFSLSLFLSLLVARLGRLSSVRIISYDRIARYAPDNPALIKAELIPRGARRGRKISFARRSREKRSLTVIPRVNIVVFKFILK